MPEIAGLRQDLFDFLLDPPAHAPVSLLRHEAILDQPRTSRKAGFGQRCGWYTRDMRITVRLFAGARDAVGSGTAILDLPAGATAADALAALVREYPALRRLSTISRLAIDGDYAAPDTPLADGAELAVLPPVSGG